MDQPAWIMLVSGPHPIEVTQKRISQCMHQLRRAGLVLDRVLVERGDEEGRRLVESARWLAESV
jgi:hypothetical protein